VRVALVATSLRLRSQGGGSPNTALAPGFLEAAARRRLERLELARKDFPIRPGETELAAGTADEVLATDPELVGLSSYCWDTDALLALASEIRRRSPSTRVVIGGPTATFGGASLLERNPQLDAAVQGEGEITFAELLARLGRFDGVAGIAYREGDRVFQNAPRPPIADLGELPSPYVDGTLRPPSDRLALEWSRGCVFRCRYCAWKNFLGPLRHTPARAIEADMRWAVERGYRLAFVLDAAINFETERLRAAAAAVAGAVPHGALRFSYFLSQQHFSSEQLEPLSALAAHEIWVGLESVDERALRAIGRPPFDPVAFERMLDELAGVGPVYVSIMLGIPGDGLEGFRRTVDYLARVSEAGARRRVAAVRVFWMLAAPGSYFADRRESLGIRLAPRGMPYVLGSDSFPDGDMKEAFRFLFHHPRRDLFIWDDPSPAAYFDGLSDLDFEDRSGCAAPEHGSLAVDALRALVPACAEGAEVGAGWRVLSIELREGWPTVSLERGARRVAVQVRRRSESGPHFVRTRRFELLWMDDSPRGSGPREADGTLLALMGQIAAEIRAREETVP
jgi:radical SAM superfamily enzyme YgiQ (UPF0313 family)